MKKPLVAFSLCLVLAACADVTGDAVQVNGVSFDRSEINDLLSSVDEELRQDPEVLAVVGETPAGTMATNVSTTVITILVQNEALRQQLEAFGIDVSEADILAVQSASQPSGSATVDRLFAELNARDAALGAAGRADTDVLVNLDVRVDARYGQWVPEQGRLSPNPGPGLEAQGL